MKVLFISGADQEGGTYQMARNILKYVPQCDKEIKFIVLTQKNGRLNQWCDENGIENYSVPYRYCVYFPPVNPFFAFIKRMIKLLSVSFFNRLALRRLERMDILSTVDVVHTNNERDLFGMIISKKYDIPNITHIREFLRADFGLELIYNWQVSYMNQYSRCFIAVSGAVKNSWVKHFGLDQRKISIIYDGIEPKTVPYKSSKSGNRKVLRIIMNGTICEGKNQFELIKAISILQTIEEIPVAVDFYGRPPSTTDKYYRTLLRYIQEKGLSDIFQFKGQCDHTELLNRLPEYDMGVMCSKSEGFGLVTIEYMLAGIYVIASNTGANPELLEDGKTGFIYEWGDAGQLATVILHVYHNRENYKEVAGAAHEHAKIEYSIRESARKLVETYYDPNGRNIYDKN